MSWPIVDISHTVHQLRLHDENGPSIFFDEGEEEEAMAAAEDALHSPRNSQLNAFFAKCRNPETLEELVAMGAANTTVFPKDLLYEDFNEHYYFDLRKKEWIRRQKNYKNTMSRMYTVSQRKPELFAIRSLLREVKGKPKPEYLIMSMIIHRLSGPKGFEDLRTFNGIVHPTAHACCLARGLFEDNEFWINVLQEAADERMGTRSFRSYFVHIGSRKASKPGGLLRAFSR